MNIARCFLVLPTFACVLSLISSDVSASVQSVSPARNSMTSARTTDVVITFATAINPQTIDSVTFKVFGHWSGPARGTVSFEEGNRRLRFTPSRPFNAGEYVVVNLAKSIQDSAGVPMSQGYAWMFWVRPSPGNMVLQQTAILPVRRSGEGHIQTYGAYGGDFNGDGWMDLAMPNELTADFRLMMNDGAGNYGAFTVHSLPTGNTPSPNEGADFNSDYKLDYAVGNAGNDRLTIMIGNGDGTFASSTSYQAANAVRGVAVLDLDGDGHMDVVTANRNGNNLSLFRNNGNGTFGSAVNMEANGLQETACAAADANNDGIMDLFVGTYGSNEMILLLGNGTGGLTFSSKVPSGGRPWMIAVGDVNGDGNVDVVSANSFNNNCSVILGNGAGGLATAVTYPTGGFPLAIDLGDIDGDGDLDLVSSNYSGRNWTLYENNGSGVLTNMRTLAASRAGSCATLYDRDNDGDLDMTGIDELDDLVYVFTNPGVTSVEPEPTFPSEFTLFQNYPNPFNPTTTIQFSVSQNGRTILQVFDLLGREVELLFDGHLERGKHDIIWNAENQPGGVYFYRLRTGGAVMTRSLVLLK